ncbi:MAG: hypothetical protein BWY73_01475 [candidate division TA06 bacterium ADurb.Bin417]|uniref:Uncharacterized protein n=1 Tax=candidate division TA06 bacterium ADurb.Bin417 TaxID=1852828 RepID=A0A1V5M8M4_UNCT6|nr:MAG: hypothetical protein BWY73_01475 [candidate division TA06 bacterium ADurb.Bin417]
MTACSYPAGRLAGRRPDRPLPGNPLPFPVQLDPPHPELAFQHVDAQAAAVKADAAVAGGGREEATEAGAVQAGRQAQPAGHRRVVEAGEGRQQGVAGHGPGVIVAALVLVPGVAGPAVVAVPGRPHQGQPLGRHSFHDQVAGHLVLEACPDLVRIWKGQGRPAAARPGAEEQPGLVADGVSRPLGAGVLLEVSLEIMAEDGAQAAAHVFGFQRQFQAVKAGHPGADHSVGQAALAILVTGPLAPQNFQERPPARSVNFFRE